MQRRLVWLCFMAILGVSSALADGPQDNLVDQVRPIPPLGVTVPDTDQSSLQDELAALRERIDGLRKNRPAARALLPDVEIFWRAVDQALRHGEFFSADDIKAAHELLQVGMDRCEQLERGESPWEHQTGLVVRGYQSRLDKTVQPYGLVIPRSYRGGPIRLDVWLHGRGEKLSEVSFLNQRLKQTGPVSSPQAIVLHPYGRYCNAFKFAGEVDVLEALADVQQRYQIDEDRVAIRGFSMGGAGCWQLAVHYPDLWFAATPGAGFSETPEFLRVFQDEKLAPLPWEQILWRWYDCPGYAANIYNCPTIAYSGELDRQKQAADIMEQALANEQMTLTHLIGPETKHSIHPESAQEIERRLVELAAWGRDRAPRRVQLATYTLKYNRMHWLTLNGLEKHWEQARADAEFMDDNYVRVRTTNVTGFTLRFPAGWCPFDPLRTVAVEVNGVLLRGPRPESDRSWTFHCWNQQVRPSANPPGTGLWKRAQLQGPIDDAFMDSFIVVRPTGTAASPAADAWARGELQRLVREWRRHFRGDAVVKDDRDITPADIAASNLILFGDPGSNSVMAQIIDRLPLKWTAAEISVGGRTVEAPHHAPVMIYPNPLQPKRYVVINSGFTFREYDYLNNARQVSRLPDWGLIDIRNPPDSRYPGKVVGAGFFNERWQ